MSRTLSTPGFSAESSAPGQVQLDREHQHWCIAAAHCDRVVSGGIDWFSLRESPTSTRVKSNSQRDVWMVRCGDATYFAKLYHPQGLNARLKTALRGPTAMREWRVGRYAAAYSIAAVVPAAVAWVGSRSSGGTCLLITEAVCDAQPLSDYWLAVRDNRRQAEALSESLARLIARSHQCGFQHCDMHPGNILVRGVGERCEAFFVDLHKVHIERSVSMRQVVANIAQLNQWFRRNATRAQRRRFLKDYVDLRDQFAQASPYARNWRLEIRRLVADLDVKADRHAASLWAKRDRRTYRTGRYFARIKPAPGWRGHVLLQRKHPNPATDGSIHVFDKKDWESWLRNPLSWLTQPQSQLLKDSHTSTVAKALLPTDPATAVIAKRPLARNFWKRLIQMFGPSRNMRSWRIANMLRNRDLPAAQPLAVVERFVGLARIDSIGFTEYLADSTDLETFLTRDVAALRPADQRRVKDLLIESLIQLLRAFHDRGFVHRDLKAPNLLVIWRPPYVGLPTLTFVDMDGIRLVRRSTEEQRLRAVTRLCASLLASPACTRSDRLRYLKRSLTCPGCTPARWKAHWRHIDDLVRTKLHDKELRRQWKLAHYGRE